MFFKDYFQAVDISTLDITNIEKNDKNTYFNMDKNISKLDLNNYDIAIIGISEERNTRNKGTAAAPDKIRQQLYKLNI